MINQTIIIGPETISPGLAVGNVINLNVVNTLSAYKNKDFQALFDHFNKLINDFYHTYLHEYVGDFKKRDNMPYHIEFVLRVVERECFINVFKKTIKEKVYPFVALEKAFDEARKQTPYLFNFNQTINKIEVDQAFAYYSKRMSLKLNHYILYQDIKKFNKNTILCLEHFNVQYLYELTKNIKGIITKNYPKNDNYCKEICKVYEIPLIYSEDTYFNGEKMLINSNHYPIIIRETTNQATGEFQLVEKMLNSKARLPYDLNDRKLKLYAPMVNDLNIEFVVNGPYYSGIAPFRTEYLYITKGIVPTVIELCALFSQMTKQIKDKEIFFRLPDFRPDRPTKYLNDEFVDLSTYDTYPELYNDLIYALAMSFKQNLVHIVLPMIRLKSEILSWRSLIESIFENYNTKLPQIGIMFETESQFEYYEDYDDIDFAIIGLNDFIEEFDHDYARNDIIPKKEFFNRLNHELRAVHQFFRLKKIRHLIAGNVLTQPDILERILKMGFREICLPIKEIEKLDFVIKDFVLTKNKYVGISEQRKKRALPSKRKKESKKYNEK